MLSAAVASVALRSPRMWLAPLASLVVLWLLPAIPENVPATEQAVVVQPNIDPEVEWNLALQDAEEKRLHLLSNAMNGPLVIWPELPAPLYYYDDPELRDYAKDIAERHGSFLFETVAYTGRHEPLNSAVLIAANGTEVGRYDQIDLVPFGEYVPPLFSWVNRITKETSDFTPGHDIKVFPAGGHHIGVFICYESAFPGLVRRFSAAGADVLVNLSNDGYFGHSEAREQHLMLVRMRAVENRRFVIRSTNDGITAVVDPAGRLRRALPPYREIVASMKYGTVQDVTFYAKHGDWFAWSCLVAGVGSAVWRMWRERKSA
jgi:apolipoprotein N-acyltransferase